MSGYSVNPQDFINLQSQGIAQRKQNGLAALMGQYASGGAPDYAGIAQNGGDPVKVRNDLQDQHTEQLKRVGQFAGYLASIPDPVARNTAYQQLKPQLSQFAQQNNLPLPDNVNDSHVPELQAIAQQFGSLGGQAIAPHVIGNALVNNQGRVIYQGKAQPHWVWDSNRGMAIDLNALVGDQQAPAASSTVPATPSANPEDPTPVGSVSNFGDTMDPQAQAAFLAQRPQNGPQGAYRIQPGMSPADAAIVAAQATGRPESSAILGAQPATADRPQPPALPRGVYQVAPAIQKPGQQGAIAKRSQEIGDLQAQGIKFTPEQRQTYLITGKIDPASSTGATADNPLGGLSQADAAFVKKMANGLVLPSDMGMRTATGMSRADAMGRAILLNPNWSPDWARQVKAYTEGLASTQLTKPGGILNSMGTVINHLGSMMAANERLKTFDVPTAGEGINSLANAFKTGEQQTALKNWTQGQQLIAQELGKLVKNGVVTESESKQLMANLSAAGSKNARNAALAAVAEFAYGRIGPLEDQRNSLLQDVSPRTSLLNASQQKILSAAYALDPGIQAPDFSSPDKGRGQIMGSNIPSATDDNIKIGPLSSAPAAPKVGEVRKGYRYKGGPANDPHSWEPVQ